MATNITRSKKTNTKEILSYKHFVLHFCIVAAISSLQYSRSTITQCNKINFIRNMRNAYKISKNKTKNGFVVLFNMSAIYFALNNI